MIYTVTFNPAIDYVVHIPDFKPGSIRRSTQESLQFGGKGVNVSIVLGRLGVENAALGFVAGFTGRALEEGLTAEGVRTDFIRLHEGFTRINVKIKTGTESEINGQGPVIDPDDLEMLLFQLGRLKKGDVLVLAGSVPAGVPKDVYRRILSQLEGKGVDAVVDAERDLLLEALAYRPFLIKPNHRELGDMVGIGAAPSTGKTAFALQWAARLSQKYRVGFYSLETNAAKAADRLVAQLSGTPLGDIKQRRFTEEQWARIGDATSIFAQGKFEHIPASSMSAMDIVSTALSRRHQVVIVDYIQLIGRHDGKTHARFDIVTNTSLTLHQAAQTHGILVVALSQLSRPEKKDGKPLRPDMHSFRESGQIEQDLDVAMLLYLSDPDDYTGSRICKIGKNKEGRKGEVELDFDGTIQRFTLAKPNTAAQLAVEGKKAQQWNRQTGQYQQQTFVPETGEDKALPF